MADMSQEDYELRDKIDGRIDLKLKKYDERLWERIKAYIAEHISPQFQQLFFGFSIGKWVAGVVVALAIGTVWQIFVSFTSGGGGGS